MAWTALAHRLIDALGLEHEPLSIHISDSASHRSEPFRGDVAAGCALWGHVVHRAFTTDRVGGNCDTALSVRGFLSAAHAAHCNDVQALLGSGWISKDVTDLARLSSPAGTIRYGPLASTSIEPSIALLRVNPAQAILIADAISDVTFASTPQCRIVADALEDNAIVVSLGCAQRRQRTGMSVADMMCAIPGSRLEEAVEKIESAVRINGSFVD